VICLLLTLTIDQAIFTMASDDLTTDQMIKQIFTSVKNIETSMSQVQSRVVVLEDNVAKLNKQVYDLQNVVNSREQELKSLSVRVTGFPFTDEEKASTDGKYLSKKIYDRILTPILNQAKTKNHIERVPTLANTIQSCFRVGQAAARTGTGAPPPVILKLSNDVIKLAIMRNKRQATPAPTPGGAEPGHHPLHRLRGPDAPLLQAAEGPPEERGGGKSVDC
jgi:hypothetical protein